MVPDRLWRLDVADALAAVALPGHLHWSGHSRIYRLADRSDRTRVYEIVLREGTEADLLTYIDGALLTDIWDDLILPAPLRAAWSPLIARYLDAEAAQSGRGTLGTSPTPPNLPATDAGDK